MRYSFFFSSRRRHTRCALVTGVQTCALPICTIRSKRIGCVAAGHSAVLAARAGFRLPIQARPLQALVSEPVKPVIDTVVMSNAVHMYIRSEEHTSELQSLMRISYAVFCLKKKKQQYHEIYNCCSTILHNATAYIICHQ